jgi:GGDEF domain-containing protein
MPVGPPRPRRPRPVADAPAEALLGRTEDLTKGWLLAWLEQLPLREAPAILAADLAREGPRVCEAAIRALADDAGLSRIEPGGALEPLVSRTGELAGAQGVEEAARAVETLRAVIWSALREELHRPHPDQIAELAERLAFVIEQVRGATLRRSDAPSELADPPRGAGPLRVSGGLGDGALEDEIVRAERLEEPLSLLLVELDEVERVTAVEAASDAEATFDRFAQTLRGAIRRHDKVAGETQTRAWITARDTDRIGALALGARIASSVGGAELWRGAPLTVSIGLAVLGEDGTSGAGLIEAAEESKYAAAASGVGIAQRGLGPTGELPPEPGPRLVR